MSSPPPNPSEADIIFNRAAVALAKSQRLIASWLPPLTASELANAKPAAEIEREEQEMFTPVPELLGLGASPSQESVAKQQKQDTEAKLRLQMLGKDHKPHPAKRSSKTLSSSGQLIDGKPKPAIPALRAIAIENDSDEEGGRSSLGKSKRKPSQQHGDEDAKTPGSTTSETTSTAKITAKTIPKTPPSKRSSTYLDEILAEKARKRSKKKGNQGK